VRAGPAVVAIGGGHGLACTLRAASRYAGELTAIVSVADDGGSSGRLRASTGLPAPGDVRRCLTALADPASPLGRALEHRFAGGDLDGHALGNLLIAGLAEATGDFTAAIDEAARLVGAAGRVLPASTVPVVLKALTVAGAIEGQVAVQESTGVMHVTLEPPDPPAPPAAVEAVDGADQIVLGPGSLFTSVLAALAVPAIGDAVAKAAAPCIYVCNLRPQVPETEGYDVAAHIDALAHHGVEPDVVVCHPGALPAGAVQARVVEQPVARDDGLAHDPARLSDVLRSLV
jgi:uncharacterized cofD-like protein